MVQNLAGFRVETQGIGYVGRTLDGDRLWIRVELRRQPTARDWQTVDHRTVSDPLELGISGLVVPKGRRTVGGGGQTVRELGSVIAAERFADGMTAEDLGELFRVWKRWHSNAFRAGCVHQPKPSNTDEGLAMDPCPETGYRWGSAWLAEVLPDDVAEWVRGFAARLDGTEPNG